MNHGSPPHALYPYTWTVAKITSLGGLGHNVRHMRNHQQLRIAVQSYHVGCVLVSISYALMWRVNTDSVSSAPCATGGVTAFDVS